MKTLSVIILAALFGMGCAHFQVRTPTYSASATTISKDIHVKFDSTKDGFTHVEYDSTVNGVAIGEAAGTAAKVLVK